MKKENLQQLFDRITVKLHNDGIGNIDVAYIDYDDTSNTTMVMKPVFVAFHDRDFNEYFKLAFTADMLENKPSIKNPLGDPMLTAMNVYQTVKDYYLQWRKNQMMSGSWGSQSDSLRAYAREKAVAYDPASAYATQAYAAQDAAITAKLAGIGASVYDKSKAALRVDLGTADAHTSAPWDDPLKAQQTATHISKQYTYMMQRRVELLLRAVSLLEAKKKFIFTDKFFHETDDHVYGNVNCRLSIKLPDQFPYIVIKNLDFDITDRMFDNERHFFDDYAKIPVDEKQLSEMHLILRLAYIIYKAAGLRDRERINNEVIRTRDIKTTEGFDF